MSGFTILTRRGEASPNSKLTDAQVIALRRLAADGTPHNVLAEDFGISATRVGQIVRGRAWRHILPAVALAD